MDDRILTKQSLRDYLKYIEDFNYNNNKNMFIDFRGYIEFVLQEEVE